MIKFVESKNNQPPLNLPRQGRLYKAFPTGEGWEGLKKKASLLRMLLKYI